MRFATVAVLALVLAGPSTGAATRDRTIASYCSPSGDICYGILNRGGQVVLQLTTAAHYFDRYTLCVTRLPRSQNPEHAQRCGAFPVLRGRGGTWGSSVNYARQYPVLPPGRQQVTWRQVCSRCPPREQRHSAAGSPLGPSLFFSWPVRK
jgi:hypothetical protein